MRSKIIAVNVVIVLVIGLLAYALMRGDLANLLANRTTQQEAASRALSAANNKLELDARRVERWLAGVVHDKAAREPFKAGTPDARADRATSYSGMVKSLAVGNPAFAKPAATLVALVDDKGVSLGRDGSNLMRGEDVGTAHPALKAAIQQGVTASDVWADAKTGELLVVSYAPVHDDSGAVLGVVLIGAPLNDERLQATSELTSGRGLILGVQDGDKLDLRAKSGSIQARFLDTLTNGPAKAAALATLGTGAAAPVPGPTDVMLAAAPLSGYGDGKRALVIAVAPASLVESVDGMLWPVVAATVLGIILVIGAGVLLGAYISRPIEEIEEGLLAILNGKTDLRFEIEHPELGGLVFRLNSLLNQLMGVQEDDTDDEGRSSRPAQAQEYGEG